MRQAKIEKAFERAEELQEQGDTEQAKRWYYKAAKAGYLPAELSLADLLDEEEHYPEAEFWYREAARTGDALAVFNLAGLVSMRGDEDQAQKLYRLLIDNAPLFAADAAYGLSQSLQKEGRPSEAAQWLHKAYELGFSGVSKED